MKIKLLPILQINYSIVPGEIGSIEINEPFIKELVTDIEINDIPFGVVFKTKSVLPSVGVLCVYESILSDSLNGKSILKFRAVDAFTLTNYYIKHPVKSYPSADVELYLVNDFKLSETLLTEYRVFAFRFLDKQFAVNVATANTEIFAKVLLTQGQKRTCFKHLKSCSLNSYLLNTLRLNVSLLKQFAQLKGKYYLN